MISSFFSTLFLGPLTALAGTGPGAAPVFEVLARVGDPAGQSGQITYFSSPDTGGGRHWTAIVGTDSPVAPWVILVDGRNASDGDIGVPGYWAYEQPRVNADRVAAWPGTEIENSFQSALFVHGRLALLEGDPVAYPGAAEGLVFRLFRTVHVNRTQVVVSCVLDDANPGPLGLQVLLRLVPDERGGFRQELLAQSGESLPGMSSPIAALAGLGHQCDLNAGGDVLFLTTESNGQSWVYLNDRLVLREGQAIGPDGLILEDIYAVNTNDLGDVAVHGRTPDDLQGVVGLLAVNGQVVAVAGDPVPGYPGQTLQHVGGSAVLTNAGEVLWWGRVQDAPAESDEVLFLGERVLLREGETLVDGQVLSSFSEYDISDDGRVLVFTGGLGAEAGARDTLIRALVPKP